MYRGVALRKYQLMKMTPSTTAAAIRMIVTMVLFFHGIIYIYSLSK